MINEISVKIPSKLLTSKITVFFDNNFDPLSMNNITEAEKLEPELKFEKTINDIKDNHLENITSIEMNLSAINLNKSSTFSEHLISYITPWILLQSPGGPSEFTNRFS